MMFQSRYLSPNTTFMTFIWPYVLARSALVERSRSRGSWPNAVGTPSWLRTWMGGLASSARLAELGAPPSRAISLNRAWVPRPGRRLAWRRSNGYVRVCSLTLAMVWIVGCMLLSPSITMPKGFGGPCLCRAGLKLWPKGLSPGISCCRGRGSADRPPWMKSEPRRATSSRG